MKLDFIDHDKLVPARVNMRFAKKPPAVADIEPSIRKRGILVPLIVRPSPAPLDHFEIIAGLRRWTANGIVRADGIDHGPLPCAILGAGDDADAIEASLIENVARLDPDEVTQWETFTRLVKEGRAVEDIAATFGLPDLAIRRVLALGNLLPRIRNLYRDEAIDRATVRHLTLASKNQQKAWLALLDDPDAYAPKGHQLKAWLFGGQSIAASVALFDLDGYGGATVADLFGDDRYFAETQAFWVAQDAAIEARRKAYLEAGWSDVVVVPPSDHFHTWEYEKAAKRKGGRVYIDVRSTGEVTFHEGYLTRAEAHRAERGDVVQTTRATRPEMSSTLRTYVDLHRHAAVRAAMLTRPEVALRLMVAHAIVGSHLWTVRPEPQATRNDAVRESIETCRGETVFDERRRAVLDLLGYDAEDATVVRRFGTDAEAASLFRRLLDLPDPLVMEVIAVVIGETIVSGSAAIEAAGQEIGVAMADWWQADGAFLALLRDREVLGQIVAEVAGEPVADANARETGKTLKRIVADHLAGHDGRPKVECWVPRWMQFPPSAYTTRGGVGTTVTSAETADTGGGDGPDDAESVTQFAEAA